MDIEELYSRFTECNGLTTDSRHCPEGSMFLALKGETFNGNAEEAAQLVNEVRKRAFDGDNKLSGADLLKTTNVNGVPVRFGILLDEWGREFALEGLRRSQLIRFDNNYTKGEWTFHEPSKETYLNLFPIPLSEIQANNKLEQNEGYK